MLMPRRRGGRAVMSRPSTQSVPELGSSRPASSRQAVVLPLPEGPSRTMNSPVSKARSSPSSATVPSANTLRTALNSTPMAGSGLDRAEGQPAHEVLLDQEREHDDRQRRDHSDRGDLAPQRAVRRHETGNTDRERPPLEGNQHKGIEELIPAQDEAQDRRCGEAGRRERDQEPQEGAGAGQAIHHAGLVDL